MAASWKVYATALATTLAIAYVGRAIFDALFPPYGMLVAFGPHSPWPIYGTPTGLVVGFLSFAIAGYVIGALYGIAWGFWNKKLA